MTTESGQPFSCLAVLGPGLIGGSVLKAVRVRFPNTRLHAWARRSAAVDQLREQSGLVDLATDDVNAAVAEADGVILAMPTGVMSEVVERITSFSDRGRGPVAVTDVGSVKQTVMDTIPDLVRERGGAFIGSHPMAGSEKAGLAFAEEDLLEDAAVILTPEAGCDGGLYLEAWSQFWLALGGRVSTMDASRHDALVASISHLPHLIAASLVRSVLGNDDSVTEYCGGGFRDTTRVSAGPEEMWSGILTDNHEAVSEQLTRFIRELENWKEALDTLDRDKLRSFLSEARSLREKL